MRVVIFFVAVFIITMQSALARGVHDPAFSVPPPGTRYPNQFLVKRLRGILILPTPERVVKPGTAAQRVEIRGVSVPDKPAFRALEARHLGKPLTVADLMRLRAGIVAYYRAHGRPFVDVSVPPQDVTNGVLQIVILEAHIGQINVIGNHWFSAAQYRDAIHLRPGDPIRTKVLQAGLAAINQNPFRQANAVFSPGAKPGETDITIQAKDRLPFQAYAGTDDDGTPLTGTHQVFTGFTWGNVFGTGDIFNDQYTTSTDGRDLRSDYASYVIPLPWLDTIRIFGAYTTTRGAIPPFLAETGDAWQLSARYDIALPPLGHYRQTATLGFDFKHARNTLLFGTIPVTNTPADIDQFVLGYRGAAPDRFGATSFHLHLYLSPGGMMGDNTDAAFAAVRPYSRAEYVYANLVVRRRTDLPAGFTLRSTATGQIASTNLQPSEEIGLGGYGSVRGYDFREVNGDNGFILSNEILLPPLHPLAQAHLSRTEDRLRFLAFMDYGGVSDARRIPGDPAMRYLWSIGLGLRYRLGRYLAVRFDYGFDLIRTGLDNNNGSRADFSVVASF